MGLSRTPVPPLRDLRFPFAKIESTISGFLLIMGLKEVGALEREKEGVGLERLEAEKLEILLVIAMERVFYSSFLDR